MPEIEAEAEGGARRLPALILGMGNVLRRDEGLGVRALQRLAERYAPHDDVRLVDGGTLGLDLLSYLEEAERLLVLDAALTDGPPGTLLRVAGDDVPAFFGMRSSPHEVGLPDLLAVARLRGTEPPEVVVLGMQPGVIELGWDLSPAVTAQLDALVTAAVDQLRAWGFDLTPIATSADAESTLEGDLVCTK
jgi:hydrogenase maturation protease